MSVASDEEPARRASWLTAGPGPAMLPSSLIGVIGVDDR